MRKYIFSFLFIFIAHTLFARESTPKRELRAAWIATVSNIDWPSRQGLSAQQQQQEFINHLNFLQGCGFNAVVVQVRPAADAFYASPYEPWSKYLSGKQGQPPFPKYDPLEFMISECHKRNMEFHAWFNPFRALVASNSNPNPADHATRTHPDWIIHYGGKSYFDPGNPEAREYVLKVILDVVSRYDVDAIHIDDYFYPYPVGGMTFPDQASYAKYNTGMSRDDWRRNNVNLFISQLNMIVKKEKSWVKFGVSPFGIWRNDSKDPRGSATRGTSCYDDLYSDVKLWAEKKWVDYLAPQLYWERGHRVAAYDVLLPWGKENVAQRQLFIGLGIYRMVNAKTYPWNSPNEILAEMQAARAIHANGFIFYSASSFNKIKPALADSLRETYFGNIAIPPATPWLDNTPPAAPAVTLISSAQGNFIRWEQNSTVNEPLRYLVYRFEQHEKTDLTNSSKILALTRSKSFTDKDYDPTKSYRYVVTALDRLWNESEPSNIATSSTD